MIRLTPRFKRTDTRFPYTPLFRSSQGMAPMENVRDYRDFVFCRLNPQGQSFEEFFGESLSTIDNMIDRSPAGRLEVAGGVLRYMHDCNWKMLVDNQTDTCHPMWAHDLSAGPAARVRWAERRVGEECGGMC